MERLERFDCLDFEDHHGFNDKIQPLGAHGLVRYRMKTCFSLSNAIPLDSELDSNGIVVNRFEEPVRGPMHLHTTADNRFNHLFHFA